MDAFNPTTKTQAALTAALQAASAAGNPEIRPAHLLMALLTQTDGIAGPLLEAVGVSPATIRAEAQHLVDRLPTSSGATSQPQLSRESLAAINAAQQLATEMNDEFVSTEHLMVGLATGDSDVATCIASVDGNPIANGAPLPDSIGVHSFVVTAIDKTPVGPRTNLEPAGGPV